MVLRIEPTPASDPSFEERWAMCFRKVAFWDEKKANKMAKRLRQRAYLCPVFSPDHWHLTKRESWEVT